jgi:protein SCO1/2
VVLALVYYRCPVLCSLVERGVASGLKPLALVPGRDFEVVFVSIDPADGPEAASERKRATLDHYGRDASPAGWHFLSGDQPAITALAEAVGFRYALDPVTGQYAHAAGVTVATPGGKLSRYLYGVDYAPRDFKLALVESSDGKIGSPVDRALLLCFRYDANLGKYTAATMLAIKAGATLTLAGVVFFLVGSLRRERRARRLAAGGVA